MIPNNIFTNAVFTNHIQKLLLNRKSEAQWRSMTENAQPYIVKARTKFRGFFAEQLDECIAYLNRKSVKAIEDDIIDWDKWIVQFEEFGQLLLPEIISQWGPEILGTLTTSITFDMEFPYVQNFINDHSYRMAVNVNETTKQQLRELFDRATLEGDSVPQIERKLRTLFEGISKDRANMIARSEVIRAHNAGAESAYIESGVVNFKQWWASVGERRTCRFCNDLHGKIIPVGTTYFTQGDTYEITDADGNRHVLRLNYSDIRFPPLHVRCRCVLLPVRNLN